MGVSRPPEASPRTPRVSRLGSHPPPQGGITNPPNTKGTGRHLQAEQNPSEWLHLQYRFQVTGPYGKLGENTEKRTLPADRESDLGVNYGEVAVLRLRRTSRMLSS